jgi:hypothetical protein
MNLTIFITSCYYSTYNGTVVKLAEIESIMIYLDWFKLFGENRKTNAQNKTYRLLVELLKRFEF